MPRIIAIDYGLKRCGLAWTDPDQIIASGLETVPKADLLPRLQTLCKGEAIEGFLLGFPTKSDGSDTDATQPVRDFEIKLKKAFPGKAVMRWDERYSSRRAMGELVAAGVPKKKRRNKALLDQMSATLILQEYLESQL